MCERCVEIDKQIEYYRKIQRGVTDPKMIAAAEQLIAEADKAALHTNATVLVFGSAKFLSEKANKTKAVLKGVDRADDRVYAN